MITSDIVRGRWKYGPALLLAILIAVGCDPNPEKLMASARQEREKGNNSAAIIHLREVLQETPDNAEARYLLGLAYNTTGDFASAEKELRKALELRYDAVKVVPPLLKSLLAQGQFQKVLDEAHPEAGGDRRTEAELLTSRALAWIGTGRISEGGELLAKALQIQPEFADALLGQARIATVEKKFDEAARLIERAIASAPSSVDAWLMKGDLHRMLRQNDAAAAYQKVLELNPDNLQARLSMVLLQIAAGNLDDAGTQLDRARKVAPQVPIVGYMGALIEYRRANYPAARDAVLQVLKVVPNHLPSVLLAGAIEYAQGSHTQAQSYLARVVTRAPSNLYARKLLVASLTRSGDTQRARDVLEAGLKQGPDDAELLALAGEVAMHSNDFARASEYFGKATKADPKSAGARTGLAMSRLASGEADRALADLETAVQLDSDKYQADTLLVNFHLYRNQFDQALQALQSLEKKQPDNPLTYNLKAAAYLGKKDIEGARKNLQRALELRPTYLPAALTLARLDLQNKNRQAARGWLEAVLAKDPNHVGALLALANFGPQVGATVKDQILWLERAQRASPGSVHAPLMLARLYARIGEPKKALEFAQRAQISSPNNVEVLETLGPIQTALGENNQALTTYQKLATLQPKSANALFRLANAQIMNRDARGAAATLKQALTLKPDFSEALLALTGLEIHAGRFPEAMKIALQLQKQNARSPLGFALEGDVLLAEKKYLEAAKAYEAAYALGSSGLLAMKIHTAYIQGGKPEEGERRLAQWLKASPDDVVARLYQADASLNARDYKNAIEQYEWVRRKQPDNVVVLNNLSWLYQQVKDPRALETAERAYKLNPNNAEISDTLGLILVEKGDTPRGLELLQKAAAAAPNIPRIRYHLAQAWLKSGDKAKALEELKGLGLLSGGTKFPEHKEALDLLKQLSK